MSILGQVAALCHAWNLTPESLVLARRRRSVEGVLENLSNGDPLTWGLVILVGGILIVVGILKYRESQTSE